MENCETRYSVKFVRELLAAHGIKPSKSLGQNFLIDANIPGKLVNFSGVDKSNGILEVGPGLGALTIELYRVAGHVTAVEIDAKLIPILSDFFKEHSTVDIIQGDILKLNIKKLITEKMPGLAYQVCANLPYGITTPAIAAFIEADVFKSITVMIQKEVAQRICAKPGSKEYGAFTVFTNYHTEPEILFDVPPECFTPRPKVTSSVVKMVTRSKQLLGTEDEKKFFLVVRAAFSQRRKTLVNALYSVFNKTHSKEVITEIVKSCGFDTSVRGENLSVLEFTRLSAFF